MLLYVRHHSRNPQTLFYRKSQIIYVAKNILKKYQYYSLPPPITVSPRHAGRILRVLLERRALVLRTLPRPAHAVAEVARLLIGQAGPACRAHAARI